MQGNVALGKAALCKTAALIEMVDRGHHRFALVIQQQGAVHKHDRALAALPLPPTLSRTDQFAAVKVDVVAAIAKRTFDFANRGHATPFAQDRAQWLAQTLIGRLDAGSVTFATRRGINQCDIDNRRRLRHRLAARLAQQHRPTTGGQFVAGRLEALQPAHAPRHDQGMIGRAPEQQTVISFAPANSSQ
ncbi:hypothetical protein D3C81_1250450 [compost metagenome]